MSETYAGRATARFGIESDFKTAAATPPHVGIKPPLPTVLSWAILVVLGAIVVCMLCTPFVEQSVRFIPAIGAAIGFFALFALVSRAKSIRAR